MKFLTLNKNKTELLKYDLYLLAEDPNMIDKTNLLMLDICNNDLSKEIIQKQTINNNILKIYLQNNNSSVQNNEILKLFVTITFKNFTPSQITQIGMILISK